MSAERPRILHMGPDVPGGMSAAVRGLLASPLGRRYRLEFVPTHRGRNPVLRLVVYGIALLRLTWWSVRGRGRIVHVHATKRGSMFRKAVCVLLAKALRRRAILHIHSGPGDLAAFRALLGRRRLGFLRFSFQAADVVLAVSKASAVALELEFDAGETTVLPNAAPAGPKESVSRPDSERPLAVYLGGFENPVKGGEILIEALARPESADLSVLLAGPGDLPETGQRLIERHGAVQWRGWLDEAEKDELLRRASIFILASTSEGLPMALLEAMAYELAIVATMVGGVPDVVEDGTEALLIPAADPASMARALKRLDHDSELRERLGRAARGRAGSIDETAVADRLDAIYRQLLVAAP